MARSSGEGRWSISVNLWCPLGVAATAGLSCRPKLLGPSDVGRQIVAIIDEHVRGDMAGKPWQASRYLGPLPPAEWEGFAGLSDDQRVG